MEYVIFGHFRRMHPKYTPIISIQKKSVPGLGGFGRARTPGQGHFRDNPKAATRLLAIGERRPDPAVNTNRLAAFTLVTNTIMNLDEAIMEN